MWTCHWTRIQCAALLLLGAAAAPAMAQPTAGEVARNGINRIRAVTSECITGIRASAARAANRIDELQAAGNDMRARFVAKRVSDEIAQHARRCVARVHEIAETTIQALRRLEADPALIESVRSAAGRSREALKGAVEAAKRHIAEALAN